MGVANLQVSMTWEEFCISRLWLCYATHLYRHLPFRHESEENLSKLHEGSSFTSSQMITELTCSCTLLHKYAILLV